MDYKKYRWFFTSSEKLVLGGKTQEQNEELIKNEVRGGEIVMHTVSAGSPFVVIKSDKVEKEDFKEAAIFCARYSKEWKKSKGDIKVHIFKGKDIYKNKDMKTGTFGVKKFKVITVKKEDITNSEK
ncbi:DUF814 domain-containing protein [Candidatus Pacearchaeota archaeon]|nr:DUF814 domain-containing protein [Candidatus Pacearchaeota archaeon]